MKVFPVEVQHAFRRVLPECPVVRALALIVHDVAASRLHCFVHSPVGSEQSVFEAAMLIDRRERAAGLGKLAKAHELIGIDVVKGIQFIRSPEAFSVDLLWKAAGPVGRSVDRLWQLAFPVAQRAWQDMDRATRK